MNTVDELLDEAAQLDKDALALLLGGVKRLLRDARAFDLAPRGKRYRLIPLDEKEAYSFPFEMIIAHTGHDVSYLFVVAAYKSSLEMRFRKVVPANDPRLKDPIYYPPGEEFSEEGRVPRAVTTSSWLRYANRTFSSPNPN
jgi:hypothetical protein